MELVYPRMIYKTREDHIIVKSLAEEEEAAKDGYGRFEIVVLGQKPEGMKEPEVINVKIPVTMKLKKISKKVINPIDKYKKETGKRALAFGNKTKAYKVWLKEQ